MPRAALALSLLAAGCAHRPPAPPAPQPRPLAEVDAAALQGDGQEALRRLAAIPEAALGEQRARAACLRRTLAERSPPPAPVGGAFAAPVLAAYRAYWLRSLLGEAPAAAAEAELAAALRSLLERAGHPQPASASIDDLAEALGPPLLADGLHSLRGRTLPFLELMLWRTERPRTYQVALPEGEVAVKVVFLEGFAAKGWADLATCGGASTGGWTTPEALYCVAEDYDLGSEAFAVSYLGHEAQHLLDGRRWPKLEQPELEYRAKLAELALARETGPELLARFAREAGTDRAVPHAFAAGRVMAALSRIGGPAPLAGEELRRRARELLAEDTREREKK